MGAVWQDLRYVLRRTGRAPLLTLTVILALTAGIGLNAAIFTMIDGNWFKPRAENDPGSFVQVFARYDSKASRFGSISVADYLHFARRRAPSRISLLGIPFTRLLTGTMNTSSRSLSPATSSRYTAWNKP